MRHPGRDVSGLASRQLTYRCLRALHWQHSAMSRCRRPGHIGGTSPRDLAADDEKCRDFNSRSAFTAALFAEVGQGTAPHPAYRPTPRLALGVGPGRRLEARLPATASIQGSTWPGSTPAWRSRLAAACRCASLNIRSQRVRRADHSTVRSTRRASMSRRKPGWISPLISKRRAASAAPHRLTIAIQAVG
jgi:hypothetical protein